MTRNRPRLYQELPVSCWTCRPVRLPGGICNAFESLRSLGHLGRHRSVAGCSSRIAASQETSLHGKGEEIVGDSEIKEVHVWFAGDS